MKELVSIIIPVYNCEKYIEDCLNSVINQSYKNLEVIIVNDGSTDKGIDIIKRYLKNNKKWIFIDQKNSGLSVSRNNGFDASSGKYIFFLDSDDEIPNDAIEKLINCAIKNNSDIVIGNMINYNSKGKYPNYTTKYIKNMTDVSYKKFPKLLSFIHAAGKLYKRETIKDIKFIPKVKHEDNYYNLSLYLKNTKISMISDDVYYHRIRENNENQITQNLNYESFKDLLINYERVIKENNIDYKINRILSKKMMNYVVLWVDKYNKKRAKLDIKKLFYLMDKKITMNSIQKLYLNLYRNIYMLMASVIAKIIK